MLQVYAYNQRDDIDMLTLTKNHPWLKGGFRKMRGIVNNVRTIMQQNNEHIYVPDLRNYTIIDSLN